MVLVATQLPALDSLPAALLGLPNWVAWKAIERGGKVTKVPLSAIRRGLASSTDPRTWSTYELAANYADAESCDGIGFVFTRSPFVGIDLDHCIDPRNGAVAPWAFDIVARFNSYTELSPSGTGLHIFVKGKLPPGRRRRHVDAEGESIHIDAAIEVYDTGRYFTVTGRQLPGTPGTIVERTTELDAWHAETFAVPESPPEERTPSAGPVPVDDARLIALASESKGGDRFARLWAGDLAEYDGDESRADLALCNQLAFWTDRDPARIDRLFRQSALYRKKWERKDYRDRTIAQAIAGTPEGYGGPALDVDVSTTPARNGAKSAAKGATVKRTITTISAPALMGKEFPEPRYAVPGLLPEGLCILAGRPKLGKSWLALGLALSVSSGAPALGSVEVDEGDVLFMALEDGERRLQRRLSELLNDQAAPARLTLTVDWPRINEGGLQALEEWLAVHPDARLVVVDTFKRIRPQEKVGAGIYAQDYEAVQPLADLSHRFSVSIVLVMHTRKADAEDPLDLISGSLGLSGAADGALVMKRVRGQSDALLSVIDRDAEESEKALRWNIASGGWLLLGDADEYKRSQQRNEILALLHDMGNSEPKEIAEFLNKNRNTVRRLLQEMVWAGLIVNAGGTYMARAPRPLDVPPFAVNEQREPDEQHEHVNRMNSERGS